MEGDLRYIEGTVNGKPKDLRVYCLNDLHFGSSAVDYDLWEKIKKDIRKHRDNARIIIGGDVIECVTKQSKGEIYGQKMSPQEQIEFVVDELYEFRDLIDAVVIGNHDVRLKDETSIDPMKYMCTALGIKDKYVGYECLLSYSWNKCFYSIQMHHGSGGASTPASILNKAKKMRKTNCDVLYFGHHHAELAQPFIEYQVDPYNHKLKKCKRWYLCGNTITKYAEYAKKFMYEEKFTSQAVIVFNGNPKNKCTKIEWIRGEL